MSTKQNPSDMEPESSLFDEEIETADTPLKPAKSAGKNGHANDMADEKILASADIADEDRELDRKVTTEYDANTLRVLEGREAVRQRPAMYIGDTGSIGLHHLFYEILDNCVDEVLAGRADEVDVTINKDRSISVRDNGNGIPTGINKA